MTNPFADPYLVLSKVYLNGQFLKQAISSTPVEPLNKNRTVKICYGVLDKDYYLEHIIGLNATERPKTAVRIILKIALYMLEFMGKALASIRAGLRQKVVRKGFGEIRGKEVGALSIAL